MASKTVKSAAALVAICTALVGGAGAQASDDYRFLEANTQIGIGQPSGLTLAPDRAWELARFAEANTEIGLTGPAPVLVLIRGDKFDV